MKIITFIQSTDGKINSNSIEAFSASQKISEKNNAEIYLLTFDETLADQLASYQSNGVIIIDNSELKNYNPIYYLSALESIFSKYTPDLLFFGHTYETRDWVPRLSARLDLPFISDSTNFTESIFGDEYPSKPDGHNWPRSYEQYKTQVGGLQKDMDDVFDIIDEYEEKIEELEKLVSNLRVEVAKKKDK